MKKILTLAGGYSNEREISLITAKSVIKELKNDNKYNILLAEPDGNFVKKLRKFKPDLVLNLLHGRYGEDGYIQAILESEKVKYTHSGVISSSLAIDKEISKKIFKKNAILTPKYIKIRNKNKKINFKERNMRAIIKSAQRYHTRRGMATMPTVKPDCPDFSSGKRRERRFFP